MTQNISNESDIMNYHIPEQSIIGDYWVWMTEKFIIFTKNKMGSRYLGHWSSIEKRKSSKIWTGVVSFDFSYNIIEERAQEYNSNGYTKDDFLKEMKLVSQRKSLKEIVFIYRDPEQRVVSGLIQELHSVLSPSNNRWIAPHMITYHMLFKKYKLNKYIRLFRNQKYIRNFNLDLVEPHDIPKILRFILDWISASLNFGVLNYSHTDKFCEPYYQMMQLWDKNKIILINLDYGDNKDTLKFFLKRILDFNFGSDDGEIENRQSNGNMVKFILNMQSYLKKSDYDKLSEASKKQIEYLFSDYEEYMNELKNQIEVENYYYDILQSMDNNFHNKKHIT